MCYMHRTVIIILARQVGTYLFPLNYEIQDTEKVVVTPTVQI